MSKRGEDGKFKKSDGLIGEGIDAALDNDEGLHDAVSGEISQDTVDTLLTDPDDAVEPPATEGPSAGANPKAMGEIKTMRNALRAEASSRDSPANAKVLNDWADQLDMVVDGYGEDISDVVSGWIIGFETEISQYYPKPVATPDPVGGTEGG